MTQKVFVLGATGNVGRALVRQIVENPGPARMDGLAASPKNGRIYCEDGIRNRAALDFSERRIPGLRYDSVSDLLKIPRDKTVFIDTTNGRGELLDFHRSVIAHTDHSIVTANKFPLTICTFEQFNALTNDRERYRFSPSVMGGAGALTFIRNCQEVEDRVIKIEGCLSGTLNYIPNQLENGMKFSDIVREAHGKCTEPHPADDLDGGDVMRKALILARTAGLDVKRDDIRVIPFIPQQYLAERDLEKFFQAIKSLDHYFGERTHEMGKLSKVLRYVATVTEGSDDCGPRISVGPEFVDRNSPLGSLKRTDNMVTIWTKFDSSEGYRIGPAAGAGNEITAMNIRRELSCKPQLQDGLIEK